MTVERELERFADPTEEEVRVHEVVDGGGGERDDPVSAAVAPGGFGADPNDTSAVYLERGRHPLGVKPFGDALASDDLAAAHRRSAEGLGRLRALSDGLLLQTLGRLDARALLRCAQASRVLYAFAAEEDLWRRLVLQRLTEQDLKKGTEADDDAAAAAERDEEEGVRDLRLVHGSWKATYLVRYAGHASPSAAASSASSLRRPAAVVRADGVYSDVLFHSWRCASAGIATEWLQGDDVPRWELQDDGGGGTVLDADRFDAAFVEPNLPVVLTGWKPHDGGTWSRTWLLAHAPRSARFNAGGFAFSLRAYFTYLDSVQDDQPLYLFDRHFAAKFPALAAAYRPPAVFGADGDLFSLLPAELRPDWRWLIVGGRRSGSSFHKDPNESSAWNGVVRGAKRWLLLPPECSPPGVSPSPDGGSVTAPLSAMEWFLNFFPLVRDHPRLRRCTTVAGEVLYVPRGWWHIVLNLEETVAVTQNFCRHRQLRAVLQMLRDRPEQLSGVDCAPEEFERRLRDTLQEHRPELLRSAERELEKRHKGSQSLWSKIRHTAGAGEGLPVRKRARTGQDRLPEEQDGGPNDPAPFTFNFQ